MKKSSRNVGHTGLLCLGSLPIPIAHRFSINISDGTARSKRLNNTDKLVSEH